MPKLNKWLVTSIIEDIKELIAVANDMSSCIGKVDHLSWRFPTKFAKNVDAMAIVHQHRGSAGELYILLLEIAYDRLHFVLRLVLEFIDRYPFIEGHLDEVTKSKRPQSMSLAIVVRTLWEKLKLIPETLTRNMIQTKHLEDAALSGKKSSGCQISGSLSHCESCTLACGAITDLMEILSSALKDSNLSSVIAEKRNLIQSELFEKTQWAVMRKFSEAIRTDMKTLLKTTSAIKTKNETDKKRCEKSIQNLAAEVAKEKSRKSSLESEIRGMSGQMRDVRDQLEKSEENCSNLVQDHCALTEKLSKTEEKSSNLETFLSVAFQQQAEMAEHKLALLNTVKHLQKKIETNQESSSAEIKKLKENLQRIRDENISIKKQFHERVENLEREHIRTVEKLEEDFKLQSFSSCFHCSTEVEVPVPKGDPETDMAKQLAANLESIEKLTRQNERLSKTLNRLRDHRRNS